MKVLVVRPMEMPEVQEIDHTLSAMQELVGGTIQAVYPFDDPVALVCNDEGKLLGLPMITVCRMTLSAAHFLLPVLKRMILPR